MICIHSERVSRCLFCHKPLHDEVSRSRGIGHDCWEQFTSGVSAEMLVKLGFGRDFRFQDLEGAQNITLKPEFQFFEDAIVTVIQCLRCGNVRPFYEVETDILTPFKDLESGRWGFVNDWENWVYYDSFDKGVFQCKHPQCGMLSRYIKKDKKIASDWRFNGPQGLINSPMDLKQGVVNEGHS